MADLPGAQVLVEEGGGGNGRPETPFHAFASASLTLTLAILGSSVLPLPYAFSRLGVAPGVGLMLAVALGNAYAGTLLLRAAGSTGRRSFEGLAEAVGGPAWKAFAQVALVLLLYGNVIGDFCLLSDMGVLAARQLFPGDGPAWLLAADGRVVMAGLVAFVVLPLSCLRHMRQLERLGASGFLFVVALAAVLASYALSEGLPALASGELPLWRPAVAGDIPEAVGVLSFSFYLTPMLLPLLKEMPVGRLGVDLTCRAVQVVTVVVALGTYAVLGFFGAARYGLRTQGDVMMNDWLPGRWEGALSAGMLLYLTISVAPMAMTLRCQLEDLFMGEEAPRPRSRQVALTAAALAASLAPALAFPRAAEKVFAVTGATAVCAVVYLLPVAIHLKLYFRKTSSEFAFPGSSLAAKAGPGLLARRRSFSFDHRLAAAAAAAAACGIGDGADTRWLLAHDHLARPAAHAAGTAGAAGAAGAAGTDSASGPARRVAVTFGGPAQQAQTAAAALQQQQQQQQGEWGGREAAAAAAAGEAGDEEEGGELAAVRGLLPSRWTDLSLNRWLQGQSYDSLGRPQSYDSLGRPQSYDSLCQPDSLPQTPVSPAARAAARAERDSLDSPRSPRQYWQRWEAAGGPAGRAAAEAGAGGERERGSSSSSEEPQQAGLQQAGLQPAPALLQASWSSPEAPLLPLPAVPEAAPITPPQLPPPLGGPGGAPQLGPLRAAAGGSPRAGRQQPYPCIAAAGRGWSALGPLCCHVALPVVVMLAGAAASISALFLAVAAITQAARVH